MSYIRLMKIHNVEMREAVDVVVKELYEVVNKLEEVVEELKTVVNVLVLQGNKMTLIKLIE